MTSADVAWLSGAAAFGVTLATKLGEIIVKHLLDRKENDRRMKADRLSKRVSAYEAIALASLPSSQPQVTDILDMFWVVGRTVTVHDTLREAFLPRREHFDASVIHALEESWRTRTEDAVQRMRFYVDERRELTPDHSVTEDLATVIRWNDEVRYQLRKQLGD